MNRRLSLSLFYLAAGLAALTAGPRAAYAEIEKSALWRDAVATDLSVDFGAGFLRDFRRLRSEADRPTHFHWNEKRRHHPYPGHL